MKKVIVICGPTAVGKTAISIELAKMFDAEIISGDSVQVYRGLDIGSAKITEAEKDGVKHHLIDIMDADDMFDVAMFQRMVREKINQISIPFVVGGTGLYIKGALYDYNFETPKRDIEAENKLDDLSNDELHEHLRKIDFDSSLVIHKNNRRRVLRAIQIASHKKRSELVNKDIPLYEALIFYITMPRAVLYERINQRVDIMMAAGFLEEARNLYDKNIKKNILGYRELNLFFDGVMTLSEATDKIKQLTRHLAQRQETWFKNQMAATLVDATNQKTAISEMKSKIADFLGDL